MRLLNSCAIVAQNRDSMIEAKAKEKAFKNRIWLIFYQVIKHRLGIQVFIIMKWIDTKVKKRI